MQITSSSSNSKSTEIHKYKLIKVYDQNEKQSVPSVQFYIGGDNDDKDDAPTATAHTHTRAQTQTLGAGAGGALRDDDDDDGHRTCKWLHKIFFFSPTKTSKLHALLTHIQ